MSKKLVAYFSASGTTKKAAERLAKAAGADLFEIKPKVPYSSADLNWMDKKSRSSVEMNDPDSRPEIAETIPNMVDYDTVFIGCPVWWWTAPIIINTFTESYDFKGKTVIPFCTYASTYRDETLAKIVELTPDAKHLKGFGAVSRNTDGITEWLKEIKVIK